MGCLLYVCFLFSVGVRIFRLVCVFVIWIRFVVLVLDGLFVCV